MAASAARRRDSRADRAEHGPGTTSKTGNTPTPTSGVSAEVVTRRTGGLAGAGAWKCSPRPAVIGMVTPPHLMSGTWPLTDLCSQMAMRPLRRRAEGGDDQEEREGESTRSRR